MPVLSRAAVWQAVETVGLIDVEPRPSGPDDVVVEIGACGICGSDIHAYAEGAWVAAGQRMGHEYAGTVSSVGSEVAGLSVGDRVAVNPMMSCGECPRCREGLANECAHPAGAGGGFADRVVISGATVGVQLFVLPDHLSFTAGAFLEPLSVAARAVRMAAPPLDEPILVFGLGTIGQCVLQVLLAAGADDVIVVDTSEVRREAARTAGAHEVIDPTATDVRAALLGSRGRLTSLYQVSGAIGAVFETSGAVTVLPVALELARAGASISLIGLAGRNADVDLNHAVQKELRLLGSFAYAPRDAQEAFRLLVERRVRVEPLVSHTFALADIAEAFETQRDPSRSIKVMVTPSAGS